LLDSTERSKGKTGKRIGDMNTAKQVTAKANDKNMRGNKQGTAISCKLNGNKNKLPDTNTGNH